MSTFLLGYSEKGTLHYVRADDSSRAICGTRVVFVPVVQPADPFVHEGCQELLAAALAVGDPIAATAAAPLTGTCPDCGGSVDLDDEGFVAPHRTVIMRGGRMVAADEQCDGAGALPEELP